MEGVCRRSLYMSPVFIARSDVIGVDVSELSRWQRIKHALQADKKDEFVELINSPTSGEEDDDVDDYPTLTLAEMFHKDAVDCAAAVLDGETAGMLNLTNLSDIRSNAFLEAVRHGAPRITSLLLEKGFIAADVPVSEDANLKYKALTLALSETRWAYMRWDDVDDSAVKLVTRLSEVRLRRFLETLRLLAYSTKETKHAFVNCLKAGKMLEVGALLLVASEFLFSSSTFEEDGFSLRNIADCRHILFANKPSSSDELKNEVVEVEELLKLLEIFDKIGDKLAAYVRLDGSRFRSDDEILRFPVSFEIASLLEDGGFHVSVEDTYDQPFRFPARTYGPATLQRAPVGGCDNFIHDALFEHMLPSWWMRNRALPPMSGKSDNCAHLSRRLFSTTTLNRKSACLAPTKRLTNGVRCWSSKIQFASVVAALKKGLRHA